MDSTFELTPAACTGDGRAPLGGLLNKQYRRRVDELEKENRSLRTLLVDLNVGIPVFSSPSTEWCIDIFFHFSFIAGQRRSCSFVLFNACRVKVVVLQGCVE